MHKRLTFITLLLSLLLVIPVFADPDDTATLGGQDSNGKYYWRVNSGNLIPGTTSQNDIGSATYEVDAIYTEDLICSDQLYFETNLLATGIEDGGATTMVSGSTDIPLTYSVVLKELNSGTPTDALNDGTPGQQLTVYISALSNSGTLTIDPTTTSGFDYVLLDTVGDYVTLLYVDDTVGWIITGSQGVTITDK